MKTMYRVLIVGALACAVVGVFILKHEKPEPESSPATPAAQAEVALTNEATGAPGDAPGDEALPRLVDLGAGKCWLRFLKISAMSMRILLK